VKTDGQSIFIASGHTVSIVSAQGRYSQALSLIDASGQSGNSQGSAKSPIVDGAVAELMLSGSTLAVLYQLYTAQEIEFQDGDNPYVPFAASEIVTQLWDVSKPSAPRHLTSFSQSGRYSSSRLSGDLLYLISDYAVGDGDAVPDDPATFVPQTGQDGSHEVLPAEDIKLMPAPEGARYTVVTAVDVAKQARLGQQSVLGGAETVYMSGGNLYLAAFNNPDTVIKDYAPDPSQPASVEPDPSQPASDMPDPPQPISAAPDPTPTPTAPGGDTAEPIAEEDAPDPGIPAPASAAAEPDVDMAGPAAVKTGKPSTHVVRIALDGGELRMAAQTDIPGVLINQFALDEYENHLRVATTTMDEYNVAALRVLDADLKQVGAIPKLANNENIESVRFQGKIGYVVTFRQTDPLFAIDLANPAKPKVLSELKIPGFSSYLHPYGDGLLLGLGMDGDKNGNINGLKLAMFDVSDPKDVTMITSKSIKYDTSQGLENHKAVLVDSDNDLIGFDATDWRDDGQQSRYLVYGYDEDKGFSQHKALPISTPNGDTRHTRGLRVGGFLYVLSDKQLDVYTLSGFNKAADLRLP
jgi:uncharacterized secreted protein with C-terminal beta-propeller domain